MADPFKPQTTKKESIEIKTAPEDGVPCEDNATAQQSTEGNLKVEADGGAQGAGQGTQERAGQDTEERAGQDAEGRSGQDAEERSGQDAEERSADDASTGRSQETQSYSDLLIPASPPNIRRRKPSQMPPIVKVGAVVILSILPTLVAAITPIVNPASWPYMKAQLIDNKVQEKRLADYAQSLKIQESMDVLQERANYYEEIARPTEQQKDLQQLVNHKVNNGTNYLNLATMQASKKMDYAKVKGQLHKAFSLINAHSQSPLAGFYPDTHMLFDNTPWFSFIASLLPGGIDHYKKVAFNLIAIGDSKFILDFCEKNKERVPVENLFLEGLAKRELGQDAKSRKILQNVQLPGHDYPNFYWFEPEFFVALLELDHYNTRAAAALVKTGEELGWNNNIPAAWLAYEQGNYAQCLKRIDGYSKYADKESEPGDIPSYEASAAMRLLRAHALLKLNKPSQAKQELSAYYQKGFKGTIFIPKVYRNWIIEPPATVTK